MTPDERADIAAHDNKGFSEERCLRCGWVMGSPPLNCNNDNTPHRFPSHSPISPAMTTEPTGAIDMHNYEQNAHLPECIALAVRMEYDDAFCICLEVRACKARVRTRRVNKAEYRQAYRDGKNDMLDAARDAVAAVEMGGEHFWSVGFRDGITNALAAIDGLTNGQKEA